MKKKYYWITVIVLILLISLAFLISYFLKQPIENECELNGGKCYGFGDFVAETCKDHEMAILKYDCPEITINTQCCKETLCSQNTPSLCDKSCKSDDDCGLTCICGCISNNDNCKYTGTLCEMPGPYEKCRCINNKCEYRIER